MQQGPPTVGDTVTIVRRIAAAAGAMIEARPPADSIIATLVAPPVMTRDGDSVRIAYTLAVWAAGHNDLVLPGAIIVDQLGKVDTLADTHVALDVATVLPTAKSANSVAPKTARPWVAAAERSEAPFTVLIPLAILLALALHWWWRRRGPRVPSEAATILPSRVTAERIAAWRAAGESRLALDHIAWAVRHRDEFTDWRAAAAAARYSSGNNPEIDRLLDDGWARLAADAGGPATRDFER